MKIKLLLASAVLLSGMAQAQQPAQQDNVLGQLLGAVFGTNQQASEQTFESDWNQGRRPFEQRRAQLDARIEAALRDGSLSRGEADQMRREYNDIVRLEAQYSAQGGVSAAQRSDLRQRYRALTQRVSGDNYGDGYQGGNQGGYQPDRWEPLSTRSGEFEARVAAGLRDRSLSQVEATRLRGDFRALLQTEASYQRGGIDSRERADLETRYDAIDRRLGGNFGGGNGFGNDANRARWSQIENRLAVAERRGSISRSEAVQIRAQLGDLTRLDAVYATGGYNADQRGYLTRRYNELAALVR